jgi:hypothetical protein
MLQFNRNKRFTKILGDIRKSRCTTGIKDTGGKFATSFASVVDTGGKFAISVNDTSGKFAAGVNDTGCNLPPERTTPVANLPPVSMTPAAKNGTNIINIRDVMINKFFAAVPQMGSVKFLDPHKPGVRLKGQ